MPRAIPNETNAVPRVARALDVMALVVFLGGALLYARSWLGLRGMDAYVARDGASTFAAIAHADALSRLGRIGIGVMAAGVAIGVIAALVARSSKRRAA